MNEIEKLKRDIDTIRESVHRAALDLDRLPLSPEERDATRRSILECEDELAALLAKLDGHNNSN